MLSEYNCLVLVSWLMFLARELSSLSLYFRLARFFIYLFYSYFFGFSPKRNQSCSFGYQHAVSYYTGTVRVFPSFFPGEGEDNLRSNKTWKLFVHGRRSKFRNSINALYMLFLIFIFTIDEQNPLHIRFCCCCCCCAATLMCNALVCLLRSRVLRNKNGQVRRYAEFVPGNHTRHGKGLARGLKYGRGSGRFQIQSYNLTLVLLFYFCFGVQNVFFYY